MVMDSGSHTGGGGSVVNMNLVLTDKCGGRGSGGSGGGGGGGENGIRIIFKMLLPWRLHNESDHPGLTDPPAAPPDMKCLLRKWLLLQDPIQAENTKSSLSKL